MKKSDILFMCIQNLKRRRARTFLTVLGVVIGCCSIVIMVSIGIGMKESQEKMLAQMGDLTIVTVMPQQGGTGSVKLDDKAVEDFKQIQNTVAVTPKTSLDDYSIRLYAGENNRYVCDWATVAGLDTTAFDNLGYDLISGKAIKDNDNEVIAGQYLAYDFEDTMRPDGMNMIERYGNYDENGKELPLPDPYFDIMNTKLTMEIDNGSDKFTIPLKVEGQVKEDYSKGYETSEGLIMGLGDIKKIIEKAQNGSVSKKGYNSVIVKVNDISNVSQVEDEIKAMGFSTDSMESIRKPMEKEAHQKQMMLGGLGAISLFVAALGITNTMIMSISERTKEIGIMKSLGCFVNDIRIIFLTEAGIIGFMGGIVGCVVSLLISLIINMVSLGAFSPSNIVLAVRGGEDVSRVSVIPLWLLAFSVVFSILIGLCSGYYPANRAVKISALEAIKNEQ
ncbi:MAG: ABC transporter permease [Clostridia bacterium]|nr:ABC transporter permease [Clostridia bacterium]